MPDRFVSAPRSLRWFGTTALLLAAILLLGSTGAVFLSLANLAQNRDVVARTTAILQNIAELQTAVREAETGQRGYLLTGERRYLLPYERALERIPLHFDRLRGTVQHPAQIDRLAALRPLVDAKLAELADTVRLRHRSFAAALQVVRTDRGQVLMERIDDAIARFVVAQQGLLAARVAREEQAARRATIAAAASGLLSLLSAVVGVFLMYQQRSAEALARYSHELEDQVEKRTGELVEANRELDAFAYTISHDLRAPLRAMHGYADALLEDYGELLPNEGRSFATAIATAAMRMNALIEDMLAYARLARDELSLRPVSLDVVVDQARSEQGGQADIMVAQPLGTVRAHRPALQAAVTNLIANATKFVASGVKPEVRVWSELRGGAVRLYVEDNGIGIAPEHQARIFDAFERLHGAESYPGTGIGLAIVRRSIERMGGACGVVSNLGRGSRFWLELPAADKRA